VFRLLNTALVLSLALLLSCKRDPRIIDHNNQKLVFILIDGPRWQESWGDNSHLYQPYMRDSLAQMGCVFTNFYNNGITFTIPGHTALLTGHYQNIANNGLEYPMYPSLAQLFLQKRQRSANASWLVASKDKVEVLKSCTQEDWSGQYTPMTDCGNSGNGSGYRLDSITFAHATQVMQEHHPDFIFIQFKEPDMAGHANDFPGYLNGIKQTDQYAWEIWKQVQASPYYKDNTTFVITNDHGRHSDGWLDGFISHGDTCVGCRHINLFMAGPNIKKGAIITQTWEQIDLHKTLCRLFGLQDTYSDGKVIKDIYGQ